MGTVVRDIVGSFARGCLFCFMVVLVITPVTACCGHPPVISPVLDTRTSAEQAEAKSVALLDVETGAPNCGGVWVSSSRILSAFHCVKTVGRPAQAEDALEQLLQSLGLPGAPLWDPTGQTVPYSIKGGDRLDAVIMRFDRITDLVLLEVKDVTKTPAHDVAKLGSREIHDGDPVDVVGSTEGLAFTFSRCYVASVREPIPHAKPIKTIQVSGPIYFGNSGGGIFSAIDGTLLGIADFIKLDELGPVPGMGFAVHRDLIWEFLSIQ